MGINYCNHLGSNVIVATRGDLSQKMQKSYPRTNLGRFKRGDVVKSYVVICDDDVARDHVSVSAE